MLPLLFAVRALATTCMDGSFSASSGPGTCSHHGGVSSDYSPNLPYTGNGGGPTVCADGTVSDSAGPGTCSHHGGIAGGQTAGPAGVAGGTGDDASGASRGSAFAPAPPATPDADHPIVMLVVGAFMVFLYVALFCFTGGFGMLLNAGLTSRTPLRNLAYAPQRVALAVGAAVLLSSSCALLSRPHLADGWLFVGLPTLLAGGLVGAGLIAELVLHGVAAWRGRGKAA